jgi:hypothetical protein
MFKYKIKKRFSLGENENLQITNYKPIKVM